MTSHNRISRRSFLSTTAAMPLTLVAQGRRKIPIGLELYSVRQDLAKDLPATVRAVAKMGYEGVEFFSPYFQWTPDYAKEVRKLLDELGIRCYSTHNSPRAFEGDGVERAIELNKILGSEFVIMASAGKVESLDGWKKVAETLNRAAERMRPAGLRAGFHNHQVEFRPLEGVRPIEVLAKNTGQDITLQLDVGTCLEAGGDPVKWIEQNPGRITSIHCKDWSPDPNKGYHVLFGEGAAPWRQIFDAAERVGGVQYYLIEQEGSAYPPLETVERCLANFRKLRG
ncbi:MAG: sugar phosphate isomerase/epimerase [Bryobacterales bacterium]|nr:sugar phosphate isomerase/epimerase [Bryobacteraceae bacterium]MDW8354108.1 sugar phosphate isomerase/epimerase [Bryobacterales bacterium]